VIAFLYARVSTLDKEQNPEVQLRELREYCRRAGWEIGEEFVDHMSGTKAQRPKWQEMLRLVRRRKCGAVVVFRFNRFARSTRELVNWLEEFEALGVQFISLHENIDTSTPMGKAVFRITAAIAELEVDIIRENVRAGLLYARSKGVTLGRPRRIGNGELILSMRRRGTTWREISAHFDVSASTAKRLARIASAGGPKTGQKPVENAVENEPENKDHGRPI
jgi:DNA invertase Pin-like site-specific DNA recombinase